jgi:hypothetical protein
MVCGVLVLKLMQVNDIISGRGITSSTLLLNDPD